MVYIDFENLGEIGNKNWHFCRNKNAGFRTVYSWSSPFRGCHVTFSCFFFISMTLISMDNLGFGLKKHGLSMGPNLGLRNLSLFRQFLSNFVKIVQYLAKKLSMG